jgi:hypothetical protein
MTNSKDSSFATTRPTSAVKSPDGSFKGNNIDISKVSFPPRDVALPTGPAPSTCLIDKKEINQESYSIDIQVGGKNNQATKSSLNLGTGFGNVNKKPQIPVQVPKSPPSKIIIKILFFYNYLF